MDLCVENTFVTRRLSLGYHSAPPILFRAEIVFCVKQALETARTANRRLKEDVKASADELVVVRAQHEDSIRRHGDSLIAAKVALDEVLVSQPIVDLIEIGVIGLGKGTHGILLWHSRLEGYPLSFILSSLVW